MSLEKIFGRVLCDIRKERGLSQEELGFKSSYHRTYISLLERGQKSPSLNTIFRLATALDVYPSEIIQRVETLSKKAIEQKNNEEIMLNEDYSYRTTD
ncbi:MAG: helix-turn-helix transcriptional regulator [Peptococcaceae bacterium]|nr:helix-turn-helix transcriptional regulator [Peptococcaceae bacterium]